MGGRGGLILRFIEITFTIKINHVPTQILNFRDWQFEFDRELTQKTYQETAQGGADMCICANCKNFSAYREHVFPAEILDLFDKIGIDYKKEAEIWEIDLSDGLHQVFGWFHFKGRMLSGKNVLIKLPNGKGGTYDFTELSDKFAIGFSEASDLSFFEDEANLVQVDFRAKIPWVIEKVLEHQ